MSVSVILKFDGSPSNCSGVDGHQAPEGPFFFVVVEQVDADLVEDLDDGAEFLEIEHQKFCGLIPFFSLSLAAARGTTVLEERQSQSWSTVAPFRGPFTFEIDLVRVDASRSLSSSSLNWVSS